MIVLDAGIAIDSQIIGSVIGALIVVLCACVAHLYSTTARHGERLIAVETVQQIFLRSAEQNRREVVTPNPLTPLEEAILEVVVNDGGNRVTLDELETARRALFRESILPERAPGDREKYKALLPVLDARWALMKLEHERRQLSPWRRFLEALR